MILIFLPFYTRETTFVSSCLHSCTSVPSWKASTYKKFAQKESKLFSFRVDPFSEGGQKLFSQEIPPLKVHLYLFLLMLQRQHSLVSYLNPSAGLWNYQILLLVHGQLNGQNPLVQPRFTCPKTDIWPGHDKTYSKACVTNQDTDQPVHLGSLISLPWLHVPFTVWAIQTGMNENCHSGAGWSESWLVTQVLLAHLSSAQDELLWSHFVRRSSVR